MASIRVTLSEYIQDIGIENIAKDLGTSESTVKAWRYFNRVPRIKQAKQLMQHYIDTAHTLLYYINAAQIMQYYSKTAQLMK